MSHVVANLLLVYFCYSIGTMQLLWVMMYSVLLCEGLVLDRLG